MWNLFTKKEEYGPIKLDEHGRCTYKFSKQKNISRPAVSEYLVNKGFHAEYPDNKKFAVVLTHDVDDVYVKGRHILKFPLFFPENKDVRGFVTLINGKLNKRKSPYINFRKIMHMEKKYGATSSFYFLAAGNDIFGFKYDIEDMQEEIGNIVDERCEIGLHTGYHSFDRLENIKKEKKELEKVVGTKIVGVRNHVLRFKTPDSWELLAEAGFGYDTSFSYYDIVGFRNGMCHPFQPYNLDKDKKIDILEIPLFAQDMTFRFYMKINATESWDHIKRLIDTVEKFGGVLTILWHNWTFSLPVSYSGMFGKEWTQLYEKVLEYCYNKNAWITNGKELYNHCTQNGALKKNYVCLE